MGAYATSDTVLAYADKFQLAFGSGAGDDYTTSEIDAIISQFEAELNGVLTAQGYAVVPATGANDVEMLKRFVSQRVAAWAYMDTFTNDQQFPATVTLWVKEWDELLKRLRMGQQYLIDQAPQSEDDPFFFVVRHPRRDDYFTARHDSSDWDE